MDTNRITKNERHDLAERELPAWFDDAKFGITICWSAATIASYAPIPEDGIWPPSKTDWWDDPEIASRLPYAEEYQDSVAVPASPTARYHREHFGDLPYTAFPAMWQRLHAAWDPEPWAELADRAGARYVTLYAKLGDGYLLWPSRHPHPRLSGWQAERDIVGELNEALTARGIRLGVYYCGFDWSFSDREPPAFSPEQIVAAFPRGAEFAAYSEAHWRELVERYRPAILWADGGYPADAETQPDDLFRWYYEQVPDGVVNDRFDDFGAGDRTSHRDFKTYEYKRDFSNAVQDVKWEANRGLGFSFGYNRQEGDEHYTASAILIRELVDIVARGGNFAPTVGPTATGTIPWVQAQRLLAIGWWLRRFGEAIYGTRRWDRPSGMTADGLDVRFTASTDAVHAILLGTPPDSTVELDVGLLEGAEVRLGDQPTSLRWTRTDRGVRIELPEPAPPGEPAIALRLAPRDAVRSA
jgi:alpha-L-fucosidase